MIGQYSISEAAGNGLFLAYTKLFFPGARLIRLPLYLRGGKDHLSYGAGLTLGYGCRFDLAGKGKTLVFGSNCKLNDRVHIVAHESVRIGNDVLMASNIFISDTSHGCYSIDSEGPDTPPDDRTLVSSPVSIGDRVWIGEGVCILPGVTIGNGCVIGANAVVTSSFPEGTLLAGVPARAIKRWNDAKGVWERDAEC